MTVSPTLRLARSGFEATLLLAALLLILATAGAQAVEGLHPLHHAVASMGHVVLLLVFAATARHAMQRVPAMQRPWRLVSTAAVFLAGIALYQAGTNAGIVPPAALLDEIWHWTMNLVAFGAIFLWRPPTLERRTSWRLLIDALLVAGSVLFIIWTSTETYRSASTASVAIGAIGPSLASGAVALALVLILRAGRRTPSWFIFVSCGVLGLVAFQTIAALLEARGAPDAAHTAQDLGLMIVMTAVILAAHRARAWPPLPDERRFLLQWVVYVPFGLAMIAAMIDFMQHGGLTPALFALAWSTTILVLARTALLLADNHALAMRLRASDRYKGDLLRMISHEIANPLSTIRVRLHMLQQDPAASLPVIRRNVDRLEGLSTDLRQLAMAETGHLVPERARMDIAPIIEAAGQDMAGRLTEGVRLDLAVETPLWAIAHAHRVGQAVDNLLSNAAKFTSTGHVALRAYMTGGKVFIRVTDTGVGFTPEQAQELFQAFSRPNQQAKGLGLGLYLSLRIANELGGTITARSPGPGRGSTFELSLPAA